MMNKTGLNIGGTLCIALMFLCVCSTRIKAEDRPETASAMTVLNNTSYWRLHVGWKTAEIVTPAGEIKPLSIRSRRSKEERPLPVWQSTPPPADWAATGFDDNIWSRTQLPFAVGPSIVRFRLNDIDNPGNPAEVSLICVRCKFRVSDPAGIKGLKVSAVFYGGAIIYVNGRELCRSYLPKGEISFDTPAERYPDEAYTRPDGKRLAESLAKDKDCMGRYRKRVRRITDRNIPASMLRKGINVIAVEIHRSPVSEIWTKAKAVKASWKEAFGCWSHANLLNVDVTATPGSALTPNLVSSKGLQVWSVPSLETVYAWDFGDPREKNLPVSIIAAKNGTFSGRIVVSSDEPIRNLKVTVSDLVAEKGNARIPAEGISIRYALPAGRETSWMHIYSRAGKYRFDALTGKPPAQIPTVKVAPGYRDRHGKWHGCLLSRLPSENCAGYTSGPVPDNVKFPEPPDPPPLAVQPVWITVRTPSDAVPGIYKGKITVRAGKTIEVPIRVKVHDWALPAPKDFANCNNFWPSEDSVALCYKVSLWSDKHFELIGKCLELSKDLGNRFCAIHLVSKAYCIGNEQSMVRWIKRKDGSYRYDFSIFDRYLDIFAEKIGKPRTLLLSLWTRACGKSSRWSKLYNVTVLDPVTGKMSELEVPPYGTPESLAFWKPVLTEVRKRLEKRGWYDVTALGSVHDSWPSPKTVSVFKSIWPDYTWMHSAHGNPKGVKGVDGKLVPINYTERVWGAGRLYNPDSYRKSSKQKAYSYPRPWKRKVLDWAFARVGVAFVYRISDGVPLVVYRAASEGAMQGNLNGIGRVGLNFWPLPGKGRRQSDSLAGGSHYSVRASFMALLSRGPVGPMVNERFETFREGMQIAEAVAFIRRALDSGKMSPELAERSMNLLDDRARYYIRTRQGQRALWLAYASGSTARDEALFALCTEVAKALRLK